MEFTKTQVGGGGREVGEAREGIFDICMSNGTEAKSV